MALKPRKHYGVVGPNCVNPPDTTDGATTPRPNGPRTTVDALLAPARVPEATPHDDKTPGGIPVRDCDICHHRHPITRSHCPTCGGAHLFPCTTVRGGP